MEIQKLKVHDNNQVGKKIQKSYKIKKKEAFYKGRLFWYICQAQ